MFIKSYKKESKTYYLLVIVEQNGSEKPHFINTFIPEKLAEVLSRFGVEIRPDGKKSK